MVILSVVLIVPQFTKIPDIKVPDVSNMTVVEAESALKKAGFEVNVETIKEESSEVETGNVIKTDPVEGRSIKKGSVITIYESIGENNLVVEDYTGKNYIAVKTELEKVYGVKVTIDEKEVDSTLDIEKEEIVDQSIPEGKVLKAGEEITLYIPKSVDEYPDMVKEGWSVANVNTFCEKYELNCKIEEVETSEYKEGTLYYQSREPKTPILKTSYQYDLLVKVAKAPNLDGPTNNEENNQ